MRGRREGKEKMKGVIMALFLGISFLLISCGNAGPVPKEGQAATADGTIINLKEIGNSIRDAVEFVMGVEEVKSLIKSVNDLAGVIGKKIKNGGGLDTNDGQNGSLLAGVHSLMTAVDTKLVELEKTNGISNELKSKISSVKTDNTAFIKKLETEHTALGKAAATDDDSKRAILVSHNNKDKGANELIKLNSTIDDLLTAAKAMLSEAVRELTKPAKAELNNVN